MAGIGVKYEKTKGPVVHYLLCCAGMFWFDWYKLSFIQSLPLIVCSAVSSSSL